MGTRGWATARIAKGGPWRAATAKAAIKLQPTDCAVPAAAFITPGAAVAVEPVRRARRQRNTTSAVGCRGAGGAPAGAGSCAWPLEQQWQPQHHSETADFADTTKGKTRHSKFQNLLSKGAAACHHRHQ